MRLIDEDTIIVADIASANTIDADPCFMTSQHFGRLLLNKENKVQVRVLGG